mmetsp:Transcript_98040/g.266182  ORF Transcript_98040/g.266182 Transcript_98040/m.266182 type:complete len:201 (+) Transcript_98040:659-1261(+)
MPESARQTCGPRAPLRGRPAREAGGPEGEGEGEGGAGARGRGPGGRGRAGRRAAWRGRGGRPEEDAEGHRRHLQGAGRRRVAARDGGGEGTGGGRQGGPGHGAREGRRALHVPGRGLARHPFVQRRPALDPGGARRDALGKEGAQGARWRRGVGRQRVRAQGKRRQDRCGVPQEAASHHRRAMAAGSGAADGVAGLGLAT